MEFENITYSKRIYAYVVEGITDEDKLKKAGALYVIKTGGLFIRQETLNLIEKTSLVRPLIILTDPDGPGLKIRSIIEKRLEEGTWEDLNVKKDTAKNTKKVGIAQMKMKDLCAVLEPYLNHDKLSKETPLYTMADLLELHLTGDGSVKRKAMLEEKLQIHIPTSKTLCSYLNMLNLTKEEINELLKEDSNG